MLKESSQLDSPSAVSLVVGFILINLMKESVLLVFAFPFLLLGSNLFIGWLYPEKRETFFKNAIYFIALSIVAVTYYCVKFKG